MRTISGTDSLDGHLDALAEGHGRHPAAGAAAAQAQVGGAVLHRDQVGAASMGGDGRVDLVRRAPG